jgi:predicted dehydrogenase
LKTLGIIGCGTVATNYYLRVVTKHFNYKLVIVHDKEITRSKAAAQQYHATVGSLEDINQHCQHIIICTPPHTHDDILRRTISTGKIILCEKPFLLDYDEAVKIIKLANENDCEIFVGHLRRFFPQVAYAKKIVAHNILGKIKRIDIHEGTRFSYKSMSDYLVKDAMGGVLPDTGSHALDTMLYISGVQVPKKIKLVQTKTDKQEPSHEFSADFELLNNIPVHISLSRIKTLSNKITLTGEYATIDIPSGITSYLRLRKHHEEEIRILQPDVIEVGDIFEAFRLQVRTVFEQKNTSLLGAENFLPLTNLMDQLYQNLK